MEPCQKGLKSASAKMMMSVSIVEREFPVTAIIVATKLDKPTSPGASSRVPRSHHSSHPIIFTNVMYSFSQLFSCNSLGATQAELLLLKFDFDYISKSNRSETK